MERRALRNRLKKGEYLKGDRAYFTLGFMPKKVLWVTIVRRQKDGEDWDVTIRTGGQVTLPNNIARPSAAVAAKAAGMTEWTLQEY